MKLPGPLAAPWWMGRPSFWRLFHAYQHRPAAGSVAGGPDA